LAWELDSLYFQACRFYLNGFQADEVLQMASAQLGLALEELPLRGELPR
jgi:hypothetical protein